MPISSGSPRHEHERRASRELAGADLRAAEILQDRDFASERPRCRSNRLQDRAVALVRAVREVQAEHVDASGDQRFDHLRRLRAGPIVAMILVCLTHYRGHCERSMSADHAGTSARRTSRPSARLPHPELEAIAAEGRVGGLPIVDPQTGALLHALVRAGRATRVLEIGTAIGYSGVLDRHGLAGRRPAHHAGARSPPERREPANTSAAAGVADRSRS